MKKKKILVFIDSEVVIRHFIANDTFNELKKNNLVFLMSRNDIGGML